jgi:hypothetical protein
VILLRTAGAFIGIIPHNINQKQDNTREKAAQNA